MIELVLIWVALFVALIALCCKPGASGPLVLSYFLGLSMIHVPGALIYLDPHSIAPTPVETGLGFNLTVIGMAAFVFGAAISRGKPVQQPAASPNEIASRFAPHVWPLFVVGIISYVFFLGRSSAIPSGTALVSSLGSLMIMGLWFRFYVASVNNNTRQMLTTLMILPILPATTLSAAGFLGYGIYWALSAFAFFFIILRRRFWFYVGAPIMGLVGLSFFAIYFSLRVILRFIVGTGGSLSDRLGAITQIFSNFEFMRLDSPVLIIALDQRLNQNYLVGYGIEHLMNGSTKLLYGGTVQLWTLIPRALWPDKPQVGGGGDVVSNFTGIPFAQGTSVGVGQVLEFYMNFATPGVIVGFFILGIVLTRLDAGLMRAMRSGRVAGVLLYGMPGLALMQPGGNLVEVIVAFIGAVVASRILIAMGLFGTAEAEPIASPIPELAE
jgi:hypothetical protein